MVGQTQFMFDFKEGKHYGKVYVKRNYRETNSKGQETNPTPPTIQIPLDDSSTEDVSQTSDGDVVIK